MTIEELNQVEKVFNRAKGYLPVEDRLILDKALEKLKNPELPEPNIVHLKDIKHEPDKPISD